MYKDTVLKLVNAINNQNLPLNTTMKGNKFLFIDTYGICTNKEPMKTGWQGYFDWFPDYFISVEDYIENDKSAVVLGKPLILI